MLEIISQFKIQRENRRHLGTWKKFSKFFVIPSREHFSVSSFVFWPDKCDYLLKFSRSLFNFFKNILYIQMKPHIVITLGQCKRDNQLKCNNSQIIRLGTLSTCCMGNFVVNHLILFNGSFLMNSTYTIALLFYKISSQ